jgi:hypothetical protein
MLLWVTNSEFVSSTTFSCEGLSLRGPRLFLSGAESGGRSTNICVSCGWVDRRVDLFTRARLVGPKRRRNDEFAGHRYNLSIC